MCGRILPCRREAEETLSSPSLGHVAAGTLKPAVRADSRKVIRLERGLQLGNTFAGVSLRTYLFLTACQLIGAQAEQQFKDYRIESSIVHEY